MTVTAFFTPIRSRLDWIKCSSDGNPLSGHNVRAALAYAMGVMGVSAISETEHIIRLAAEGTTLEVQSRELLSDGCRDALTHAWQTAVLDGGAPQISFKLIPVVARKTRDAND